MIGKRASSDDGNQPYRVTGVIPEGNSDITFGLQVLEYLVVRKGIADICRETADFIFNDITAGSVLQGVFYIIFEMSVAPDSKSSGR